MLEFFVKSSTLAHGHINQLFFIPNAGVKAVRGHNAKKITGSQLSTKIDLGGYWMQGVLPVRQVLSEKNADSFLCDIIVNVGALGEAHSACQVSWNGRSDSFSNSEHFALIDFSQ